MSKTDTSSERLLNLVIALLNTSAPMTKGTIRRNVHGYDVPESDEAFSRMLERDKDTLRHLGVPVVTIGTDGPADEVGYRIDTASYELQGVRLDAAQTAVLGLAAGLWRDKTLHTHAARAVNKLRALGDPDTDLTDDAALGDDAVLEEGAVSSDLVSALAPRVRSGAATYDVLIGAITERRRVTFSYRAATTGELRERTVEPWRVAVRAGRWYLVGFDTGREAPRVFHLERVVGRVRATGAEDAFAAPELPSIDAATAGLTINGGGVARLALLPERAGALRARRVRHAEATTDDGRTAGRDLVSVTFPYLATFADEVAGYGDAVVVLEPAELRDAVLMRLRAAVALTPATTTGSTSTETPGDDRG